MVTVPTKIVDKNGKQTTVYKNPDKDNKANVSRVAAVAQPATPEDAAEHEKNRAKAIQMLEISEGMFDRRFTPEKILENADRIYQYISANGGESDSVSRESLFTFASAKLGIDYMVLYNKWLRVDSPYSVSDWVPLDSADLNFGRLVKEAKIYDRRDPKYNPDMDSIVPGTQRPYRDAILDGVDPNIPGALEEWAEEDFNRRHPSKTLSDHESAIQDVQDLSSNTNARTSALELSEIPESVFSEHFTPEKIFEHAHDIYNYIKLHGGEGDSVSREALFLYASEALGRPYDDLYEKWMGE